MESPQDGLLVADVLNLTIKMLFVADDAVETLFLPEYSRLFEFRLDLSRCAELSAL